jgi:hypothetical protein
MINRTVRSIQKVSAYVEVSAALLGSTVKRRLQKFPAL